MRFAIPLLIPFLLFASCNPKVEEVSFPEAHALWQMQRIERLKSATGWLNLAGLYWLEDGVNRIGSDPSNDIVFPSHAPPFIGKYILEEGSISFMAEPGAGVRVNDSLIGKADIISDRSGQATLLETGSLAWFIIDRAPKFGIRLRDYQHPVLEKFQGIETFPPDRNWVVEAEFQAFEPPREMMVPTEVGTMEKYPSPGVLRFRIGKEVHELYPFDAGDKLFIIFADETSGIDTYGGGRFLYTDKPGEGGTAMIDFNRAYSPPCAFTPFATCPLPPRENFLKIRIEAGEKFAGY